MKSYILKMKDSTSQDFEGRNIEIWNIDDVVILRPNEPTDFEQMRVLADSLKNSQLGDFLILPHWCDVLELVENGVPEEDWLVQPNIPQ